MIFLAGSMMASIPLDALAQAPDSAVEIRLTEVDPGQAQMIAVPERVIGDGTTLERLPEFFVRLRGWIVQGLTSSRREPTTGDVDRAMKWPSAAGMIPGGRRASWND